MTKVIQLPHNNNPSVIQAILNGVRIDKEKVCFIWPGANYTTFGCTYAICPDGFYLRKTYSCRYSGEHGQTTLYHPNGVSEFVKPYTDGKLDGEVLQYDENGVLLKSSMYLNGKLDGPSTSFYDNGKPKEDIWYRNGKKHGVRTRYCEDGIVQEEQDYQNDLKHGICKEYYKDGTIDRYTEYKDGMRNGAYRSYRTDGTLRRELTYKNNLYDGLEIEYKADGSIDKMHVHGNKYESLRDKLAYKEFCNEFRHFIGLDKRPAQERKESLRVYATEAIAQMNPAPKVA